VHGGDDDKVKMTVPMVVHMVSTVLLLLRIRGSALGLAVEED
jgi:hypothetical protein